MTDATKKRIRKILVKHDVRFAYLFGSRVLELGALSTSDYDIAVSLGRGTPASRFDKRLHLIRDLAAPLAPHRADVVVIDDTHSATLRYSIVTEGRVLYERDSGARIDFELRTLREYEEFKPFLKSFNRRYIQSAV